MPRFYFDTVTKGEVHEDHEGAEYPDAISAIHEAQIGAAEYVANLVAKGGTPDHEEKLIRDQAGSVIARFTILDAFDFAVAQRNTSASDSSRS